MFCVYVIYNREAEKIYVGQTGDLPRRLAEHNSKRGKHFTAKFSGEWELIYQESFPTRQEALKREKQLKSFRGREYIQQFIPG
jgi:putative endonuclease